MKKSGLRLFAAVFELIIGYILYFYNYQRNGKYFEMDTGIFACVSIHCYGRSRYNCLEKGRMNGLNTEKF